MKKIIILIAVCIVALCFLKSKGVVIPKESIRFRVVANSNKEEDQRIKKEIVKDLNEQLQNIKLVPKNIEINRNIIKANIPNFHMAIKNTLDSFNKNDDYTIEYGMNYFPKKEYKGVIYEEGEYESLVIKIGEAKGDNFWCVLFPPLCLLEGEDNNSEKVEYTTFIKEIIEKYI